MQAADQMEQIRPEAHQIVMVAEKVTKRFPGTVALDQVDFTVYAGAVNVLIGENGAGKSTATVPSTRTRTSSRTISCRAEWYASEYQGLPLLS